MQYSNLTKKQLLMMVHELTEPTYSGEIIGSSEIAHSHCANLISNWKQEHFLGLYLNAENKVIKGKLLFKGTLNNSLVHPREVFAEAIINRAANIIIAHNHPSGRTIPSSEDIRVTERLVTVGKLIGIPVIDHLLFTARKVFSFRAENLI